MARRDARTWRVAGSAAATFAVAVGVGRFVYTPILPLMQVQTSLPSDVAALLATSNYVGYFVGALLMTVVPGLVRSRVALRVSIVAVVVSLAAMPCTTAPVVWLLLRAVAGAVGAVLFVMAVAIVAAGIAPRSRTIAGWAYGGVGGGIAGSGAAVMIVSVSADWRIAWWTAAALAAILGAAAWRLLGSASHVSGAPGFAAASRPDARRRSAFVLLAVVYFLEGLGYIIAGTFLIAAVRTTLAGPVGGAIWVVVGAAAVPSTVVWTRLGERMSQPSRLVLALVLQSVGIACAVLPFGAAGALVAAILFGATFMGVATIALDAGRALGVPGAIAGLSTVYAVGQLLGPVLVAPMLGDGFAPALTTAAGIVLLAACLALVLRLAFAQVWTSSVALRCGGTPRTGRWVPAPRSRASGTRV